LLLQPRNFIYKRKQKSRSLISFNNSYLKQNLSYGNSGLMILKPLHLSSFQLFRLKLFLKRSSKKSDRTRRIFWFNAFPHIPLTRKPKGLRMGKGKGKLKCWFTNIRGGSIIIQFKNLRLGRSLLFMKQLTYKFGIPTKYLFNTNSFFTYPIKNSKLVLFKTFW
jgi:large subunit ribosomal protein L16